MSKHVQRFGDWDKARAMIRSQKMLIPELDRVIGQYSMQSRNRMVENILGQKYDHAPLSPDYVKRKQKAGLDTRTLIATGQYVRSIKVWRVGVPGRGGRWVVGIPAGLKHKGVDGKGQLDMNKLARILEFGTENIPPRPHWRIEARLYQRELPILVRNFLRRRYR